MKVYIAGPMTGYADYNVDAFDDAQTRWIMKGHEAHTPFESSDVVWQRHHGRGFAPGKDRCEYGDTILREIFAEDVKLLLSCDAIALLPGWRKSRGANVELAVARLFGLTIFDAATMALAVTIFPDEAA